MSRCLKYDLGLYFYFFIILIILSCNTPQSPYQGWKFYGGTPDNIHYSSLTQIDTGNVSQLKPAWVYHSKDLDKSATQIQVNPIIINNILYGVSPKLKLFALDAKTGEQKWSFDPLDTNAIKINKGKNISINACRGVTYYEGGAEDKKLFYTVGSFLYCIDAIKGIKVTTFGNGGTLDLHNDLGRDVAQLYVTSTTPGIIFQDMIILGTRVAEEAAAAPGHIRAYDVHTGKLRWIFHTIPYPGEPGYETWDDPNAYLHIGGANAWSGLSLDRRKGILFAPIGSASYDFYGGKRLGQDLYANCVLALEARTGKRIWHYQTVHHDVWDRDPPTPPVVVNIKKDGNIVDAVVQVTKSGFIFLLDEDNGKPVYPVEERATPPETELEGEKLFPTQPYPLVFAPFARQTFNEQDLNKLIPDSSYQELKERFKKYKTGNMYNAPSKEGTIIFPGFDGGAEWGGPSFDPATGYLYVNANEMPWILTMVAVDKRRSMKVKTTNGMMGKNLYLSNCMGCHGAQGQGSGNYPGIIDANKKYNYRQLLDLLNSGRRMMPAFNQLSKNEKMAIASFILSDKVLQEEQYIHEEKKSDPYFELPYTSTGYNKFLTREGYPAVMPPWGTLTAINLNNGKVVWKVTLGDYAEFKAKGMHTGTENYGGSVVTAGGVLFIAATKDGKLRAFNKRTGQLLWETDLPSPGFATPSIYQVNGKEFIVVACGGGKLGTKSGDAYIAFALND